MTLHCLVEVQPYDPATGARAPVRFASASLRQITGLGGLRWIPAMVEPPKTSIVLFDGDFGAPVKPGGARLPIHLVRARPHYPAIDRLYWPGARVAIYAGRTSDPWPWPLHFAGAVKSFGTEKGVLALACEVDDEPFNANVLTRTYAGTGDAEGGADLAGRVKPLVMGHAMNVEPVLIDAVNSVYQFSGYGPVEAVDALFERAAEFGAATGDHADFDALVAATIPSGRWATCLAEGLIRLGAPAYGVITGDVRGHRVGARTPRLTGSVIQALAGIAGIDAELLETDTLDALDAAVPFTINVVIDAQVRFGDMARRLALPCNHQAGVSLTGTFFATSVAVAGNDLFVLDARGRAKPQVLEPPKELAVSPPYAKTMLGANRAWRVHTTEEIAFDAPLVPLGAYDAAETYRLGNIVSSADQSEWVYINDAPSSGNAPPVWPTTSNAHWSNTKPPITAAGVKFASGATVEALKPAEPGADVTSNIPTVPETVVLADNAGVAKALQLPRQVQFTLIRNGLDVTDEATWAVTVIAGDADVAISNSSGTEGRMTITDVSVTTVVEVEADYDSGLAIRTQEHTIKVQRDGAPSSGGGGSGAAGSDAGTLNGSAIGTTMVAVGTEMEVTVGSGGNVQLTAEYDFASDETAGSQSAEIRPYRWNGSAYVAVLTAQGSSQNYIPATGLPGRGGFNDTLTGLTPAASEKFQFFGAAGGAYTVGFAGTCAAVAS